MAEIRVKVSDEEHDIIKQNADTLGMKISPYIRQVAQNPNIIHFDYSAIERHTRQVGNIEKSINMLVYTIHLNNEYLPKEIEGIAEYIEDIWKTERQLLRTVRKQWERSIKNDR